MQNEKTGIPKPSFLKPPSKIAKSIASLHRPPEVNELNKVNMGTRRRSNSFSDLRAKASEMASEAKVSRPAEICKKTALNVKPVVRTNLMRRSKSYSALSTFGSNTVKPLKPLEMPKGEIKKVVKPPPASSARGPVKRLAPEIKSDIRPKITKAGPVPTTKAPEKPKVSKPVKPAPYDYKARFALLNEKHTELKTAFLENKKELSKAQTESAELNDRNQELTRLLEEAEVKLEHTTKNYKCVCDINEKNAGYIKLLEENVGELKTKGTDLQNQLAELQNKYSLLHETSDALKRTFEISQSTVGKLELELHNAQELIRRQSQEIQDWKLDVQNSEDVRRAMHNTIQDLKGNIRVFCRVRPPLMCEDDMIICNINYLDEVTLDIKKSRESVTCVGGKMNDLKLEFSFDKVFPPKASQEEVFEELAQLVQSALDGYHVCVFAYGQTGSGKTYTMQGENVEKELGMIPRSVDLLFKKIKKLETLFWEYEVCASFLEIYNENVNDLLDPNSKEQHDIRYNEGKGVTITNLTIEPVSSAAELKQLMFMAQKNRAVATTISNNHSSRSHAVTKITVQGRNTVSGIVYSGSLNLVDLAGSENAKMSERLTETKNINKSLSTLGNVMLALHNKENHVPYRNSKLTFLLQSCLGGNSKTLMFVNISPLEDCYMESINSLRFAAKVKEVKLGSKRNKMYS